MNRYKLLVLVSTLLLLSTACAPDLQQYKTKTPALELEQFFDGKVKAWGVVNGFNGDVLRRFTVDIDGMWQGNKGTLDEYFLYDDGEQQFRRWHIVKTAESMYQGRADDVPDGAVGHLSGPVLVWRYEMLLPVDDQEWRVTFDDQMILVDQDHMMNKAKIQKFGITVATVTIFFAKQRSEAR